MEPTENTKNQDQSKGQVDELVIPDGCMWKQDKTKVFWDSGCGEPLKFYMKTGPFDNKYIFCPFCGQKIKEA